MARSSTRRSSRRSSSGSSSRRSSSSSTSSSSTWTIGSDDERIIQLANEALHGGEPAAACGSSSSSGSSCLLGVMPNCTSFFGPTCVGRQRAVQSYTPLQTETQAASGLKPRLTGAKAALPQMRHRPPRHPARPNMKECGTRLTSAGSQNERRRLQRRELRQVFVWDPPRSESLRCAS